MPYFPPSLPANIILAKLLTVDGSGSGLDADLVRGVTPGATGLAALSAANAAALRTAAALGTIATEAEANYALLAGRTGGQIWTAGNGSGDNAKIISTGHATKGKIIFGAAGTSVYDEATGRWGFGTASPGTAFEVAVSAGMNPTFRLSDGDISLPDYSGVGFVPALGVDTLFQIGPYSSGAGGVAFEGFTESGANGTTPFAFVGYHGGASPTAPAVNLVSYKHNGGSGITILAASEITAQISNGIGNPLVTVLGGGNVGFGIIPSALAHLAASTTARAQLRFDPTGAADPTSPNDGDAWYVTRLKFRRGSTTEIIPTAATQSAYTQTFSTAARTVNAYTSDTESGAYTGIDNLQAGNVYASVADLNQLRVAYETLRASYDNVMQVVNALIDDHQAFGIAS